MIDLPTVGARIAAYRRKNAQTQRQLAQTLRVCPQAVSKWERGKAFPDPLYLDELAAALRCSLDELLIGEKSK